MRLNSEYEMDSVTRIFNSFKFKYILIDKLKILSRKGHIFTLRPIQYNYYIIIKFLDIVDIRVYKDLIAVINTVELY